MSNNIKMEFRIVGSSLLLKITIYTSNKCKNVINYEFPLYKEIDIEQLINVIKSLGLCKDKQVNNKYENIIYDNK